MISRIVLVETAQPGNLGAAMRVTANFGVPELSLVRPRPSVGSDEVLRWACGAERHLKISVHEQLEDAVADVEILIGSASGRGRENLPVEAPARVAGEIRRRTGVAGLVFGNETRGLSRTALDLCDLVIRIPTVAGFPVLNLAQAVAITVAFLVPVSGDEVGEPVRPAPHERVEALMHHARRALLEIGFLDPANPDRILRKLRRIVGRAALTENDVAILHGICRQMLWAADGDHRGSAPSDRTADADSNAPGRETGRD